MCLLHTLFEYLECAIELHEKIANEVTALHSLNPRNYLFNGQEEGDYHNRGQRYDMVTTIPSCWWIHRDRLFGAESTERANQWCMV